MGSNYAALGRIVIGEYDTCVEIISSPQQRGSFLGAAKLRQNRFPDNFPPFLSDAEAGGDDRHSLLHNFIWKTLIPPAFNRLSDPAFEHYLKDAVKKISGEKIVSDATVKVIQEMTIKYIFHSILGIVLTHEQINHVHILFFGNNLGGLKPHTSLFRFCQGKRPRLFSSLTEVVLSSPGLDDYVPSFESANLSKHNYAEIVLATIGIFGCVGSYNLCLQVLNGIPEDYEINMDDKKEVTLAILEAARLKAPVDIVNIILKEELIVTIQKISYNLPVGTIIAANIGLASVDPEFFKDPNTFDPNRENLMSSSLIFNHVGYEPIGAGTRQCPGRNIAMKMASDFFIQFREGFDADPTTHVQNYSTFSKHPKTVIV